MTRPEGAHSAGGGGGGGGGFIGNLFGSGGAFGAGSTARQLFVWGLLESLITSVAAPGITELTKGVNRLFPDVPLDADQNAQAEARGILPEGAGADGALDSGIGSDAYATLLRLAAQMPDISTVMQAYWRGLIPWDGEANGSPSVAGAMRHMGVPADWVAMLEQTSRQVPSPSDAINAFLEGQMPEDEAKQWYSQAGGDLKYWDVMKGTLGSAPTPVEAATMANRGIIPWDGEGADVVSFTQAFLEGPWRNKWLAPFEKLAQYLPPPRTVTAILREGGISVDEATKLLTDEGLTPELAQAYIANATHGKAAADKNLTQSAIIDLYEAQIIDNSQASELLSGVGYDATDASYILTLADMRVAIAAIKSAVTRVESAYIGHKIARPQAQAALAALGVPSGQVGNVIQTWDLARSANVRTLSESQIVDAWADGYMRQDEAQSELVDLGYTPHDAWVLLSIKNKKALPNEPTPGPANLTP